ncbi:ATP synthase F1 subcomplex delta subunit [Bryocella elongata]|uniref:ATP synthase subunit delta n=1 Tax=Bryocella elongata TaxID=863522 RepID=A0A1H5ZDN2_9BACT|nr:ATP synthase F1 subunit delta [Bryocella elongata]SEG34381.1 ATP synthase F1 subcomplex delta subunit [Bryocella elongata]
MAAVDLRYARALAQVVEEQKLDTAAVQQQVADFADLLDESFELREVLSDPSIPESQKVGVLDGLSAKLGLNKTVRNFLAVVVGHERLHELRGILEGFAGIIDEEKKIAEAEIVTARPLDAASKQLLEAKVAELAGGETVRATYREDPSLLGGAVVKLGSTVYDGSVKAQLEQLKAKLVAAVAA